MLWRPTLYSWRNWSTADRLSDLPKVTQVVNVRARIRTRLSGPRVHALNVQHYNCNTALHPTAEAWVSPSNALAPSNSLPMPLLLCFLLGMSTVPSLLFLALVSGPLIQLCPIELSRMPRMYVILKFLRVTLKEQTEASELNLNTIFYVTQQTPNIILWICDQY